MNTHLKTTRCLKCVFMCFSICLHLFRVVLKSLNSSTNENSYLNFSKDPNPSNEIENHMTTHFVVSNCFLTCVFLFPSIYFRNFKSSQCLVQQKKTFIFIVYHRLGLLFECLVSYDVPLCKKLYQKATKKST